MIPNIESLLNSLRPLLITIMGKYKLGYYNNEIYFGPIAIAWALKLFLTITPVPLYNSKGVQLFGKYTNDIIS